MVQKNSKNRPVRTHDTVVEFERFEVPDIYSKKICSLIKRVNKGYRGRIPRKGGDSKYKGVSKRKNGRYPLSPWRARINVSNKGRIMNVEIGQFADEKDAARAYDKAAIELWGDDALTNQEYYGDL